MSAIKITLEITSITQANALIDALELYVESSEDNCKELEHSKTPADQNEARRLRPLLVAAYELKKALGCP